MGFARYYRFISKAFFGLFLLFPVTGHARGSCYKFEIDPKTNLPYESAAAYREDSLFWTTRARDSVGPLELVLAYTVGRRERVFAETLSIDKVKHCYIGCMIGIRTSPKVADYIGWLKEFADLTDCDPATHFEEEDAIATAQGALLGARDRPECVTRCQAEYGSKPRR